jgi:hypothetical protein
MHTFPVAVVAIALAFFKSAASLPNSRHPNPSSLTAPPFLNDLARADGKLWFGTAADIPGPEQDDEPYMTVLKDTKIFGQVTPANEMKVSFCS